MVLADIECDVEHYGDHEVILGYSIKHDGWIYYIQKALDNQFYMGSLNKRVSLGENLTREQALTFFKMESIARGRDRELLGHAISVIRPVKTRVSIADIYYPSIDFETLVNSFQNIPMPLNQSCYSGVALQQLQTMNPRQAPNNSAQLQTGNTERGHLAYNNWGNIYFSSPSNEQE